MKSGLRQSTLFVIAALSLSTPRGAFAQNGGGHESEASAEDSAPVASWKIILRKIRTDRLAEIAKQEAAIKEIKEKIKSAKLHENIYEFVEVSSIVASWAGAFTLVPRPAKPRTSIVLLLLGTATTVASGWKVKMTIKEREQALIELDEAQKQLSDSRAYLDVVDTELQKKF